MNKPKFLCLVVLDGWGIAPAGPGNAISLSATPNMDKFTANYPHTTLSASGESVGLPKNENGNTETGHLNLGAGRVIYQELMRINMSIADGSFFENEALKGAFDHAKKAHSQLHLIGLIGEGGVHSNIGHIFALLQLAKKLSFKNVFLHLFTDGRDSPTTSAKIYISRVREVIAKEGLGQIASIMGRFWGMDRDLRWERTAKAYFALTKGQANLYQTPEGAIEDAYAHGVTDEFIEPAVMTDTAGLPLAQVQDDDSIIFFNFRVDRPRQLARAFIIPDFENNLTEWGAVFNRGEALKNIYFSTMTHYEDILTASGAKVGFPPEKVEDTLGEIISQNKLRQLRLSESEKEKFVSYYFNGLNDQYPREDRIVIPSPKIATYDLAPEMKTKELTMTLIENLKKDFYSFILVNYANSDMVAHTGNIGATVKACQVIDENLGRLESFVINHNGVLIITADHGNAEEMINPKTGFIDTGHSNFPVPFIVVANELSGKPLELGQGILADVAPTILRIMNLPIPASMTGKNLLPNL